MRRKTRPKIDILGCFLYQTSFDHLYIDPQALNATIRKLHTDALVIGLKFAKRRAGYVHTNTTTFFRLTLTVD